MNRSYKLGVIGLVVIFLYMEWLYVLRNFNVVFSDFWMFIAYHKAVIIGMIYTPLTWVCIAPIAVKLLIDANRGSDKGELYKRKSL